MSMDDLLDKQITIRQGLDMGIITCRVLSDFDLWQRVLTVVENENISQTKAVKTVARKCLVNERTVWRSFSFTAKLLSAE